MLIIGLTGGIASGKTAVSNLFSALGVPIIDTDIIARDVVAPESTALNKIIAQFGNDIVNTDGSLDRKKLRTIVFNHPMKKKWLEDLLHPLIRKATLQHIKALNHSPYCIVVVPLLVESTMFQRVVDRVIVVDTTLELQKERVIQRDKITSAQAIAIIKTQSTQQQRLAIADDIIYNTDALQTLEQQVNALHAKYLALTNSDT